MVVDVARAYMGERATRMVTPDRARVTLTREKVPTPLRLSPYQPSPYLLRKHQGTSFSSQYESASLATPFGLPAPGGVRKRDGGLDENLRTPPISRTVGRLLPVSRTNAPSSAVGYPLPGGVSLRWFGVVNCTMMSKCFLLVSHFTQLLRQLLVDSSCSFLRIGWFWNRFCSRHSITSCWPVLQGSKKRGSADLEDGGYSSGGPIRRLRPRSSLYTPSPASGLQRRGGLGMYPPPPRILQTPVDFKQKPITMWSRNVDTVVSKFSHQVLAMLNC